MPDRTQNVLIPLPCPLCGREPRMVDVGDVVFQSIAEIVCTGDKNPAQRQRHAVATYAATLQEALAIWNERAEVNEGHTPPGAGSLPRQTLEIYRTRWNENRGPLPQATKLTGERLDKLRRRITEGLTLEDFTRAAWACSHTEFLLRGTPKQEFHATFDWLLKDSITITKVLEGQYGPTGKTETELLAEKEEADKVAAQEAEKLNHHLAQHMRQGGVVPVQFQTALFLWELKQAERPDEVYAAWVEAQARGMALAGPVAFKLREWVTARVPQVTTDATATSG